MSGQRQFSLGYLLVEVGVFAAAMGSTRVIYEVASPETFPAHVGEIFVLFGAAIVSSVLWGAAMGGLFGRMQRGAVWGLLLSPLFFSIAPLVMRIAMA